MSNDRKSSKAAMDVFVLVHRDLEERNRLGWKQHRKPMLTTDKRDSLRNAYEEAQDLVVYLREELYKRDGR